MDEAYLEMTVKHHNSAGQYLRGAVLGVEISPCGKGCGGITDCEDMFDAVLMDV